MQYTLDLPPASTPDRRRHPRLYSQVGGISLFNLMRGRRLPNAYALMASGSPMELTPKKLKSYS